MRPIGIRDQHAASVPVNMENRACVFVERSLIVSINSYSVQVLNTLCKFKVRSDGHSHSPTLNSKTICKVEIGLYQSWQMIKPGQHQALHIVLREKCLTT